MKKNNKLLTLIQGMIITSLLVILFINSIPKDNKEADKITGKNIYSDLELEKVNEIFIHSLQYVEQGELKGEDKWYSLKKTEDKEIINIITNSIKNSKEVEIRDNTPSPFGLKITHYIIFDIKERFDNIHAHYSLMENKLSITNPHFSNELIEWDGSPFTTKQVMVKLDDKFKETMKNYP